MEKYRDEDGRNGTECVRTEKDPEEAGRLGREVVQNEKRGWGQELQAGIELYERLENWCVWCLAAGKRTVYEPSHRCLQDANFKEFKKGMKAKHFGACIQCWRPLDLCGKMQQKERRTEWR